jgi:hypothetical protein
MIRKYAPTASEIQAFLDIQIGAVRARKAQQMHHGESVVIREADYQGHHIVVRTTYEVEVDGKLLMGHMGVTDNGSVLSSGSQPQLRFGD